MAKKSMKKVSQQEHLNTLLAHITDAKSVVDPMRISANTVSAVSALENWLIKAKSLALKSLAGKHEQRRLTACKLLIQSLTC